MLSLKLNSCLFVTGKCLVEFNAQQNNIEELPEKFSTLKFLKVLNMSENRLCSLPPNFSDMRSLEDLRLGSNQLTSIQGLYNARSCRLLGCMLLDVFYCV